MKNFILFLFVFCCVSLNAQSFEKGDKLLNVGIGLGNVLGSGSMVIPPTQISFEYGITDAISVGAFAGYASTKDTYSTIFDDDEYKWTYSFFGARVSYHFYNTDKIDVYGSGGIGYYKVGLDDELDDYDISAGGFAYYVSVGGKYYFNEKIGIFSELGYGIAILQVGLAVKF